MLLRIIPDEIIKGVSYPLRYSPLFFNFGHNKFDLKHFKDIGFAGFRLHYPLNTNDYFDELVDRNLLTNFRVTAKQLGISPKKFVGFLLDKKYLYRDSKGKLIPYEDKNDGLFEVKECYNDKTQWSGTQTLITPKGRETFRLLCQGM